MLQPCTFVLALAASLVLTPAEAPGSDAAEENTDSFSDLAAQEDVIYLLANSSIIFGADPDGKSEEITFVGPVHVPKFPGEGFDRRQVEDGRYQIDFELTASKLVGESYLLGGTILLGEDPDLRSLGTITQRKAGVDYPADFIVQRKVLIETPIGQLKNEDAVPVRGTIDSIPPVRRTKTDEDINVFRGEELPVQMLDADGNIGGWFYSKMHLAFAVDPREIYRAMLTGVITVFTAEGSEDVAVEGPLELVRAIGAFDADGTEIVLLGLRGTSRLLGGPIMITESFSDKSWRSLGYLGTGPEGTKDGHATFDLYVTVLTPSGRIMSKQPLTLSAKIEAIEPAGKVDLGDRQIPVFGFAASEGMRAEASVPLYTEAERETGVSLGNLRVVPGTMVGRRPCCPSPKEE